METMRSLLSADYQPSGFAKAAHRLPHVNQGGKLESGEFLQPDLTTYFMSLITAPLVVFVLCIVATILFLLAMLFRCCCWCLKCKPREMPESEQDKLILIKRRNNKLITFFAFLILLVVADHAGFWGMAKFNDGMVSIQDGMGTLKDNFNYLDSNVVSMGVSSAALSAAMKLNYGGTSSCDPSSLSNNIDTLTSAINTLSGLSSAPGPIFDSAQGYIQQYAIEGKNSAYYIFYAILLAVAVLYLIALKLKSKCMMYFLVGLSVILTVLLTLFYVVEWIVVTLFGDLCFNVTDNLINAAPAGDMRDLLRYFTVGTGENPFKSPANSVETALDNLDSGLAALTGCSSAETTNVATARAQIVLLRKYLTGVETAFDAAPYVSAYDQMVEIGICDKGLSGMFVMWVCHIFLTWGIAISMFTATLVWQYFEPEYWNLSKDTLYEKPPEQEIEAVPVGITHYADSGHVQMTIAQHGHGTAPKHDSMI